jgi:hypothetical protein
MVSSVRNAELFGRFARSWLEHPELPQGKYADEDQVDSQRMPEMS